MLKVRKLYTEPAITDPVLFKDGINIIVGEKDDTSFKNNGVGKSLCIEFLNFALLKSRSTSRVLKVPPQVLPSTTMICLDCEIHGVKYTIKRSVAKAETPTIAANGSETIFSKLDDASDFLTERIFPNDQSLHPSFRIMMGPLIRDERSEFKSLIQCYDTKAKVNDNYEPHLYFFGIDISAYRAVRDSFKKLDEISTDARRITDNIKLIRDTDIKNARSQLNELRREVAEINYSIDRLENTAGYDSVKDDIFKIETDMEALRRERGIIRHKLRKVRPIATDVPIDEPEIIEFYKQLNERLGEIVKKDLDQVIAFKRKIDEFQNNLVGEQRARSSKRLKEIEELLINLDARYKQYLTVLDQKGNLKNLKQTYAAARDKSQALAQLDSFVSRFEGLDEEKGRVRGQKETNLLNLQASITEQKETIKNFENFILGMHEFIQGNSKASFSIHTTPRKQVVEIMLRIDDDGSHSVEREKVFMYDVALLLSPATTKRHLGFLVHDNIFDVDNDTLIKNFEWLFRNKEKIADGCQYIVTLNADQTSPFVKHQDIQDDFNKSVRASFTKNKRYLKVKYQER